MCDNEFFLFYTSLPSISQDTRETEEDLLFGGEDRYKYYTAIDLDKQKISA